MKKTMILTLALGVVLTAGSALAADMNQSNVSSDFNRDGNYGGNGIVGSSHDLSGVAGAGVMGASDAKDRICIYCHHPHHAYKPNSGAVGDYSPLWNRENAVTSFTPYSNGIMMGSTDTADGVSATRHWMNGTPAVAGVSLLCMSCHDGVTAMNAYSVNSGTPNGASGNNGGALNDSAALSAFNRGGSTANNDMSNHHPIGMDYQAVSDVDDEIAKMSVEFGTVYGAIPQDGSAQQDAGVGTGTYIQDVLYFGKMECVTCHDVHNTQNQAGAERFLWVSNNGSKFCLTCHLK